MDDQDIVDTTDEKQKVVSYFSENDVIEMKQVSFWTGIVIGFACGILIIGVIVVFG